MGETNSLKGKDAVAFLCDTFEKIEPGTTYRVKLSGLVGEIKRLDCQAKITIAGFSEKRRKEFGRLEEPLQKKGSVSYYGYEQPDFCLILEYGGTCSVFLLSDVSVEKAGFGESVLCLSSESWKNISTIDIYLKNVYTGKEAQDFLIQTIVTKINNGDYTAKRGMWMNKKSSDRSSQKLEEELLNLSEAIKNPESESFTTAFIGADLQSIEFIPGDPGSNVDHTIKAKQRYDSITIEFRELVIEPDVPGKELGTRDLISTYVYFIGIPDNSRINLLIVRQQLET